MYYFAMTGVNKYVVEAVFLPLLLLSMEMAYGDGTVIRWTESRYQGWELVGEKYQLSFINHHNGIEKMMISIATETSESNALWLFPVPSSPRSVKLKIISVLPDFRGPSLLSLVRAKFLEELRPLIFMSQIYSIYYIWASGGRDIAGENSLPETGAGVTVYEHLERGGVVAEKITAKESIALYEYLRRKGFKISRGMLPMLDYYVGKDFTFIASWLTKTYAGKRIAKGLYLSFPSPYIYYPLLPTSAYGDDIVPAFIYVVGYYTPQITPQLKPHTTVDYYKASDFMPLPSLIPTPEERENFKKDKHLLEDFLSGNSEVKGFTLVTIKSPAKNFTTDLIMTPGAPRKIYLALFLLKYSFLWEPLLFLFCSCLASLLAGMLTLGSFKKHPLLFFGLGFFNFLSIIGMTIAVYFLVFKREAERFPLSTETSQKEVNILTTQKRHSPIHSTWSFSPGIGKYVVFLMLFSVLFLLIGNTLTSLFAISFEGY